MYVYWCVYYLYNTYIHTTVVHPAGHPVVFENIHCGTIVMKHEEEERREDSSQNPLKRMTPTRTHMYMNIQCSALEELWKTYMYMYMHTTRCMHVHALSSATWFDVEEYTIMVELNAAWQHYKW